MGLRASRSDPRGQKLQMISSSSLKTSNVQFLSRQTDLHSRFLNLTISYADQQDEIEQYIDQLSKHIMEMDTENLHLPLAWERNSGELCQQIKEIQLYYPVYNYRLKAEMEARKYTREGFSETQIWYIMISVVNGLANLEKAGIFSKSITIEDIRMSSEGLVKVENSLSSPEDYLEASQMAKYPRVSLTDSHIQQTYSLGMILLQMCAPLDIEFPRGTANHQQVDPKFSQLLKTLMNVMVSGPENRPLPSQIYKIFAPFKTEIVSFKPFDFSVGSMYNSITQSKVNGMIPANMPNSMIPANMPNSMIPAYLATSESRGRQQQPPYVYDKRYSYYPEQSRVPRVLQSNTPALLRTSSYYQSPLNYQNRYIPYNY